MATGVDELLDMLYSMLDEAKSYGLSQTKCVLDREKALDLIEEIKGKFPVELAEARKVLNTRTDYLNAAKREAEEIKRRAELNAGHLVDEAEVTSAAKQKANAIIAQAETKSKELRRAANEYCEDVLRRTEEALADAHNEMRRVHTNFRSAMGGVSAGNAGNAARAYDAAKDE